MVISEYPAYCGIVGSILNLAIITVDRYLKVVHNIWSKKWLRPRVIYSAMAFAWLASIIYHTVVYFPTTVVIDGVCYGTVVFNSEAEKTAAAIYHVMSFYVIIILILIFCYWRILITVRRQARVMAGHSAAGSKTEDKTTDLVFKA